MVLSVFKIHFPTCKPTKIVYHEHKNFSNEKIGAELDMELSKHDIHDIEYKQFWNIFSGILDKNVPKKRKGNHENQGSFMNKNSEKLP